MEKQDRTLKTLFFVCCSIFSVQLSAQNYAGDAFRFSQQPNAAGTARMRALGGNHAAIGADAANISGNPAGLGMYTRTEFSLGTELNSLNSDASYINSSSALASTNIAINNFAMVFGKGSKGNFTRSGWKASTFAIGYNRNSNLFNNFQFTGLNNASSLADSYVERVNRDPIFSGAYLDDSQQFDAATRTAYIPEAMYYQTYLIEPAANGGVPYKRFDHVSTTAARQTGSFKSEGKTSQWTFATGTSYKDKLYLGLSGGIANLSYDFKNQHTDAFPGGKFLNSFTNTQLLTVAGRGVNVSAGFIYRPNNQIRIGGQLHSPTWYTISETFDDNIAVDVNQSNTADIPKNLGSVAMAPSDFDYELRSPARASVGAALFFNKAGFITADAEYVAYSGMKLSANTLAAQDNIDFSNSNREFIKQDFNNVVNLRIGTELRKGNTHLRAGLAYMADPYKIKYDNIDRSRLQYSLGLGYRSNKYFMDVTGQYTAYKNAFTPYSLENEKDYASALIDNKLATVSLSMGVFIR